MSAAANNTTARANGFEAGIVTGTIKNTGKITVKASGRSVSATGISVSATLKGNFTNKGTLKVSATATTNTAQAVGFSANTVTGTIKNSGKITVFASGSRADATGISVATLLNGNFTNAANATLKVSAIAVSNNAQAVGFFAGSVSSNIVNAGKITVLASATTNSTAEATGILVSGTVDGNITNAKNAVIKVSALANSTAQAGGIVVTANMTGNFKNSGKITVKATGSRVTGSLGFSSAGAVGFAVSGVLKGNITNVGTIKVSATATTSDITMRGISLSNMTGNIKNTGKITLAAKLSQDGSSIDATGIRMSNLKGNFTNKGTIKVTSSATASNTDAGEGDMAGFVVSNKMTGTIKNTGKISVTANLRGTNLAYPVYTHTH